MEAMRYVLHIIDYEQKGETGERLEPDPRIIKVFIGEDESMK